MWCPSCSKSIKGGVKDSLVQHMMSKMECWEMTRAAPPPSFDDIDIAQLNEAYEWEVANAGGNMGGTGMGGNNLGGSSSSFGVSITDLQNHLAMAEDRITQLQTDIIAQQQTDINILKNRLMDLEAKVTTMDRQALVLKDQVRALRRPTPY